MNSLSKTHCNDYCEPIRKCHKKDAQKFVLLKVGNLQNTPILATSVNGTSATVASLITNTHCLDDPEIKIDFTSNIITGPNLTPGATLTFQVNKLFINPSFPTLNSVTVGPAWIFTGTPTDFDTFTFFVKDPDDFDGGLVKYTVTATVGGLAPTGPNSTLGGAINVNNATLAATIAAEE